MSAPKAAEAERVLARAGIAASVSVAGPNGEIAAVSAPAELLSDVAAHAAQIRALGFRYVALEIGPAVGSAAVAS